MMVYVSSDIHGNYDKYLKLKSMLKPDDILYIIGDVLDRGEYGISIIKDIMQSENICLLLGNHELMLLNCYNAKDTPYFNLEKKLWIRNGGITTAQHFFNLPDSEQAEIVLYLMFVPLTAEVTVNNTNYHLVHGHPVTDKLPANEARDICLWGRVVPDEPLFEDKITIFGHTPTHHYQTGSPMSIWHGEKRIGIDCGCGFPERGGRLGVLCLDTGQEMYF